MLNLNDLKLIFETLIKELEKRNIQQLELKNDFYWDVEDKELYNPYKNPTSFTLGQLSSDLEELIEESKSSDDIILSHYLKHLSSVLRGLADSSN